MDPKTETNINEAIDWLQQTGGSIQNFALEQTPIYCREVVAWEFWSSAISGGFGLIIVLIGLIAGKKFIQWMREDRCEPNSRTVPALAVTIVCLIIGFVLCVVNISRAIKATLAPRLIIVEHLQGMVE